jgi:hypothetical protein
MVPRFSSRFIIAEKHANMRYFRVGIDLGAGQDGNVTQKSDAPIPDIEVMPDCIGVLPKNSPFSVFQSANVCIYCGAKVWASGSIHPLGKEHIIPEGLGGTIILPHASCGECEDHTKRFEGKILRNLLWAPRHKLDIRMKKRERDSDLFPFTATVDGKDVRFDLPLNRHPTVLFLCGFQEPGVLIGRPANTSGIAGIWMHGLNDFSLAGQKKINTPPFDTVTFCQLLAKIAHSFAAAAFGTEVFVPALTNYIRRRFAKDEAFLECFYWCGGEKKIRGRSTNLHELAAGVAETKGNFYLLVHIRLFANLGSPTYSVVVGELRKGITPELLQARLKAPIVSPAHTP